MEPNQPLNQSNNRTTSQLMVIISGQKQVVKSPADNVPGVRGRPDRVSIPGKTTSTRASIHTKKNEITTV